MENKNKNTTNEPIEEGTSDQTQNIEENENDENLPENEEIEEEIENEEEEEEEEEKPEPDTVPLKTHLEMKKKLRDMKRKMEKIEDEKKSDAIRNKKTEIKNKWIKKGFDEDTATIMAEEVADVYGEIDEVRRMRKQSYIDEEIEELSGEDFYSDIKDYTDKIKALMKRFEDAGIDVSVDEAYLYVVGPHNKIKENQMKAQQTNIVNNKNKGARKTNVQTAASHNQKNPYKLDKHDLKALKGLREMQPDAKWTQKKYYEMMKK